MSNPARIFVYGSLMNGMEADSFLSKLKARLLGRGKIAARLVDLGEFPGAVKTSRPNEAVFGEVYEISDDAGLSELDAYEEYDPSRPDESLFRREKVLVDLVDPPKRGIESWVYFYNDTSGAQTHPPISSGDYRSYRRRAAAR